MNYSFCLRLLRIYHRRLSWLLRASTLTVSPVVVVVMVGLWLRCALRWIPVCSPLRCCDPRSTISSFRGRSRTWTLDKLATLIISNSLSGCSTVCICNPYRIRHVRLRSLFSTALHLPSSYSQIRTRRHTLTTR